MKRKKPKLGQHYLIDSGICARIVDETFDKKNENLVEIGPGKGALTGLLYRQAKNLTLIEADKKLADSLKLTYPLAEIINSRAEAVNLSELPGPFVLVSNLPYYASVHIFKHCIDHKKNISRMVLMFQEEVADRLTAKPGVRDYGSLTILASYHWKIEEAFSVPPEAFKPPPKINSTVLTFTPRSEPPVDSDPEKFFHLVRAAFTQKRRTLRNNLKGIFTEESINRALSSAGVNEKIRAEAVSINEFAALLENLEEVK